MLMNKSRINPQDPVSRLKELIYQIGFMSTKDISIQQEHFAQIIAYKFNTNPIAQFLSKGALRLLIYELLLQLIPDEQKKTDQNHNSRRRQSREAKTPQKKLSEGSSEVLSQLLMKKQQRVKELTAELKANMLEQQHTEEYIEELHEKIASLEKPRRLNFCKVVGVVVPATQVKESGQNYETNATNTEEEGIYNGEKDGVCEKLLIMQALMIEKYLKLYV